MKKIILFAVMFLSATANANITNVSISPITPTLVDPITISVNGIEGSGPVQITSTNFVINGNSLTLDISLQIGFAYVITPWLHSEAIGTLPQEFYDLTVRTFDYYHGTLLDTYPTVYFTVVPEPGTLAIFAFALPIFRYLTRV
jgi:hypothetical protein